MFAQGAGRQPGAATAAHHAGCPTQHGLGAMAATHVREEAGTVGGAGIVGGADAAVRGSNKVRAKRNVHHDEAAL